MNTETLIDEIRKLPPDQRQVVRDFVLAEPQKGGGAPERCNLHELLSKSPFADLEFDPQGIRADVRPVEL